jgi:hypothetical protein
MNYNRALMVIALLAAFGMAAVMDGIDGLGLGGNPVFPAVWRAQKRLDTGLTAKDDVRVNGKEGARARELLHHPWVSWTDALGNTYYSVGFYNNGYTSRYADAFKDDKFSVAVAQDFGNVIAGIQAGYRSSQEKPKGGVTTKYDPVNIGLGLAARLKDRHLITLGYGTGLGYTRSTSTKPKKVKTDVTQGTDIAVGYVYTASNALQLGAQLISSWTPDYDPFNTYGLAVSYLPARGFELQGFLDLSFKVGAGGKQDLAGADNTRYGVNARWTPSFAKIGTLGAGLSVNDSTDKEDADNSSSETIGRLFYTYLF